MSLRRSTMSPIAPAGSAKRKNGSVEAVWVSATSNGLAPIDTISHAAPTACMKAPTSDTTSAMRSCRKIGVRRGRQRSAASLIASDRVRQGYLDDVLRHEPDLELIPPD